MKGENMILTDVANGTFIEHFCEKIGDFQVEKRSLRGGTRDGVDVIQVRSGTLNAILIPTRGMSLHQVTVDADPVAVDADPVDTATGAQLFGWGSPVSGPVHPSFVRIDEPSGLGWLDGFDELLVRCGLTSNGAPQFDDKGTLVYPLHGKVGNLPASFVQVHFDEGKKELKIRGTVFESRFHFSKWKLDVEYTFSLERNSISVQDRVTNLGGSEDSFQLLYHFNLGHELLEVGGKVVVPAHEVIPRNEHSASCIDTWQEIEEPQAGFAETVYFVRPVVGSDGNSLAMLCNASQDMAAAVRFSASALPCFSLWKNFAAKQDGYVVGLEPATNYPNTRGFEERNARVANLEPGESRVLELELIFADSAEKVSDLVSECNQLQASSPAVLHDHPLQDYCE